MPGTLNRFDKLKALSQSMGLPNGLVGTAEASAFAKAATDKTADNPGNRMHPVSLMPEPGYQPSA